MYKISLAEIESLRGCRRAFQSGDSYCAWSKIACSALNTRTVAVPCYEEFSALTSEASDLFLSIEREIGKNKMNEIMIINDSYEGNFHDNHARAIQLAIQYALESKIVELDQEDVKLTSEFNAISHNRVQR